MKAFGFYMQKEQLQQLKCLEEMCQILQDAQ